MAKCIEAADRVTETRELNLPFSRGVAARKGSDCQLKCGLHRGWTISRIKERDQAESRLML